MGSGEEEEGCDDVESLVVVAVLVFVVVEDMVERDVPRLAVVLKFDSSSGAVGLR